MNKDSLKVLDKINIIKDFYKKMNLKKYNFHFPVTVLKEEDFSPVETFLFKDYYRTAFLDYIDKVNTKIYNK